MEFIDRNVAIVFFFAIFWGAVISSMRTFKVFHIWTFKRPGHGWRVVLRLVVGIIVLNLFPLFLCYFIYLEPWFKIVSEQSPMMFICAGISSLSVFSIVFLLPGIMQLGFGEFLYPKKDCWVDVAKGEKDVADIEKSDGATVLLLTALAYIVVPLGASHLLAKYFFV